MDTDPNEPKLHVGRPNIGDRPAFMRRVEDILDRRWLSNSGKYCEELEARLCEMLNVKHCIAMCNGTVALEIAIRALELKGEVIVPSFTFVATPHALQWQEITPVFCDIDPRTHTIDPDRVESMITPRTSGILGVHLWGRGCNIAGLSEVARRNNLSLLFDAAHALACTYNGKMIGSFGDAEVFSFHATKFVNSLEGGAVTTNRDDLAEKMRLMRNFGFVDYDRVDYIGTNGKMNEVSAAMGLTNIEAIDDFLCANRSLHQLYCTLLNDLPGLKMLQYCDDELHNHQYVVAEIGSDAPVSRDDLVQLLHSKNVMARKYFYPGCHRLEPYKSLFPHAGLLLPETEAVASRVLVLPTGTSMAEQDVYRVCNIIRSAFGVAPAEVAVASSQ